MVRALDLRIRDSKACMGWAEWAMAWVLWVWVMADMAGKNC